MYFIAEGTARFFIVDYLPYFLAPVHLQTAILLVKQLMEKNGVFVSLLTDAFLLKHLSNQKKNHQGIILFICDESSSTINDILYQVSIYFNYVIQLL